MGMRMPLRDIPTRLATGAYILHSGWEKWKGTPEQAQRIHGGASAAYPMLRDIPPETFLKLLSVAEVSLGAMLLAPLVPSVAAGAALTGFSGGLVVMYLRTPALHKPGSVWPTPAGIGISKDIWMLGIGAGLILGAVRGRRR